ncbi:MAG: universal stress protein [Candidatus Nanopelagicales bacterium]
MMSQPIVVGYDGSPASDLALEWAAQAAADRGLPLKIVVAWNLPAVNFGAGAGTTYESALVDEMRADADVAVEKALTAAHAVSPDLVVSGEVMVNPPAAALVEQSHHASMMVLGSHGHGGFTGLLLGSVSRQVATHSSCPAVVVKPSGDPEAREVVVGVDGSKPALKALDFAFDHASRRGLKLRVVHTWEVPPIGAITGVPTFSPPELLADIKGNEMRTTAEVLAGHRDRYPDVRVVQDVQRGSPVQVLTDLSEHSALVVVGSRGRGGFVGLLLGSVSHGVVHHARCPVAVVH